MIDLTTTAVLIPCYNEGLTIAKVVSDFRSALPAATIYVYDNNSTDNTVFEAKKAGAIVRNEPLKGKGNVVRRMFADINADIYVLVDGDDTYDAASSLIMVEQLVKQQLDMVNGARVTDIKQAYRPGHRFGNALLTSMVSTAFGRQLTDMLSGYRVFSRRFIKSFPALSSGFEIETELTVHALELRMPIAEIDTPYKDRPQGSVSKLRTYSDGLRIMRTIAMLIKEERPLPFFTLLFAMLASASTILAWPIFVEFYKTGLVERFPTAILSTGLMLLAFLNLGAGIILDSVTLGRRELKRMWYLSIPITHKNVKSDLTNDDKETTADNHYDLNRQPHVSQSTQQG
ncbi:MAG: glycosyltransferase family 2 protein [Thiotrichales bacterium]